MIPAQSGDHGSAAVTQFAAVQMNKSSTRLCGVDNGANPLLVVAVSDCVAGTYKGSSECEPCPRGFFCANQSTGPTPCPAGTKGTTTGLASVSDCTPCPSGFYALAGSWNCTACPAGYECPTPSSLGGLCDPGSYSLLGEQGCTACPAGYSCASPSLPPSRCSEGYFSGLASVACVLCEAGKFCPYEPAGSQPMVCPDGEYSSGGKTACSSCSPGYYSVARVSDNCTLSASRVNCTRCPSGFSCEPNGEPRSSHSVCLSVHTSRRLIICTNA